jgi:hypothetical protein
MVKLKLSIKKVAVRPITEVVNEPVDANGVDRPHGVTSSGTGSTNECCV